MRLQVAMDKLPFERTCISPLLTLWEATLADMRSIPSEHLAADTTQGQMRLLPHTSGLEATHKTKEIPNA